MANQLPQSPATRPQGRPTLCTPELTQAICEAIAKRLPIERACESIGVDAYTLRTWQSRATEEIARGLTETESCYIAFLVATKTARAQVQAESLARIRAAAVASPAFWAAEAWYLERTDPAQYGRRDRVDVERHSSHDIQITYVEISRPTNQGAVVEAESVRELPPPTVVVQPKSLPAANTNKGSTPRRARSHPKKAVPHTEARSDTKADGRSPT